VFDFEPGVDQDAIDGRAQKLARGQGVLTFVGAIQQRSQNETDPGRVEIRASFRKFPRKHSAIPK
jgi:hypothetical protein